MSETITLKSRTTRSTGLIVGFFQFALMIAGLVFVVGTANVLAGNEAIIATLESTLSSFAASSSAAADSDSAGPKTALTPRMRAVLDSVARRYRVSAEALTPVFEVAQISAREQHLDPLLIIAVIGVESGFNPFSESPMGAQGLMQVIPRFHQDKLPEDAGTLPLLDPITNVQVGAQALRESISRNGGLVEGLQQFGGAVSDEENTYANRVLSEKDRLEQVARRVKATA